MGLAALGPPGTWRDRQPAAVLPATRLSVLSPLCTARLLRDGSVCISAGKTLGVNALGVKVLESSNVDVRVARRRPLLGLASVEERQQDSEFGRTVGHGRRVRGRVAWHATVRVGRAVCPAGCRAGVREGRAIGWELDEGDWRIVHVDDKSARLQQQSHKVPAARDKVAPSEPRGPCVRAAHVSDTPRGRCGLPEPPATPVSRHLPRPGQPRPWRTVTSSLPVSPPADTARGPPAPGRRGAQPGAAPVAGLPYLGSSPDRRHKAAGHNRTHQARLCLAARPHPGPAALPRPCHPQPPPHSCARPDAATAEACVTATTASGCAPASATGADAATAAGLGSAAPTGTALTADTATSADGTAAPGAGGARPPELKLAPRQAPARHQLFRTLGFPVGECRSPLGGCRADDARNDARRAWACGSTFPPHRFATHTLARPRTASAADAGKPPASPPLPTGAGAASARRSTATAAASSEA
eukprot:scaffold155_cov106-Isochrysis_galbana.AAC.8